MRAALAVALLAAVLAAAGCGGSSSNNATSTTTEATSTESAMTETTSTETTTTDTTATDTSTGSGISDAAAAAAGLSAGCKKVADLSVEFSKALSAAGVNGTNGQADLQKTAEAYKTFASQVPEEIRGAFLTLADAFAKYAVALQGVDLSSGKTPDAATIAKLAKAAKELDNQKLTEANQTISDWVKKNCSGSSG